MTRGMKSVAMAAALALMTIGMGGAVSAADRQNLRDLRGGCTGMADCGGGGFRLNERLGRSGSQDDFYKLRSDSDQRSGELRSAQKTERSGSFRQRKLIIRDRSQLDKNRGDLLRKRRDAAKEQDRPRREKTQIRKKKPQHADSGWKFDKKKHKRRKHRNKWYRYYYGGFYYPERYWLVDRDPYYSYDPSRVSCAEGRDIVRENGYSRVSTVECVGTTFTYTGERSGRTYRITVNARTGDIVSRKRV